MKKWFTFASVFFALTAIAETYFPKNYESSRQTFIENANPWLPRAQVKQVRIPSRIDSNLITDYFYLPAEQPKSLLILTSGVHGVEAFAGAAVQNLFFKKILPQFSQRKDFGVLLVHAINPYGFKYLRRVSENNVDLNRNFGTSKSLFTTKNPGYRQVNGLLNPTEEVNLSSFSYYFSFVEMVWQILTKGMKPLRQAVLQGQYKFPKGLYFGGKTFEPQASLLGPVLKEKLAPYRNILALDVHTGYGERSKLHLFGPTGASPRQQKMQSQIFAESKIDSGDDEDFYEVHGDFTQFIGTKAPRDSNFIPMTFEFGTLDSQTSLGALKSINNMIIENQGFHYGYATAKDQVRVRDRIQEMYYPQSQEWRQKVIEQTEKVLPNAIQNLLDL